MYRLVVVWLAVVERMDGHIDVPSTVGEGTRVTVWLAASMEPRLSA